MRNRKTLFIHGHNSAAEGFQIGRRKIPPQVETSSVDSVRNAFWLSTVRHPADSVEIGRVPLDKVEGFVKGRDVLSGE